MAYLTAKQVLSLMNDSDWENSEEELSDNEDFTSLVNPLDNAQASLDLIDGYTSASPESSSSANFESSSSANFESSSSANFESSSSANFESSSSANFESSSSANFESHYPDKLTKPLQCHIVLRAVKESAYLLVARLVALCPYVCVHVSIVFISSDLMYCCYLIYYCELPFTVAKLFPSNVHTYASLNLCIFKLYHL